MAPGKKGEQRDGSGTALLAAVAHPLRIQLIEILITGDRSAKELRQALNLDGAAISQHLAVLLAQHVIEARGDGPSVRYAVRDPVTRRLFDRGQAGALATPDRPPEEETAAPSATEARSRARTPSIALDDLPRRRTRRRVVSGSMFHREVAVLNWRCRELEPVVDDFVTVEATLTHSGRPREIVRPERLPLFADLPGRLHGVVVDDLPEGPDP